MKNFLLTTLAIVGMVLAFAGCTNKKTEEQKRTDEFNNALEKAEKSPVVETELFLGFRLGMSKKQVKEFTDSLKKAGKIHTDITNTYVYNFALSDGINIPIRFDPDYYKGKLYKVKYTIGGVLSISDGKGEMFLIKEAFDDTEKSKSFQSYTFRGDYDKDDLKFYYIKDNMLISFWHGITESYMSYENVPIAKQVEREQAAKDEKVLEQSKKEF